MNNGDKKLAVEMWNLWRESHDANSKRVEEKVNNIYAKLDDIVSNMKCDVHLEKIQALDNRISWVYFVLSVVVVGGIVLGLWMKHA